MLYLLLVNRTITVVYSIVTSILTAISYVLVILPRIVLFVGTSDFYSYTDRLGKVSVGWQNNNIIYIVLLLVARVSYFS